MCTLGGMLVVFDIDGTLTRTAGIDAQLFEQAFHETLGARIPSTDWDDYEHVTDVGILAEAVEKALARAATAADLDAMQSRFLSLLDTHLGTRETLAVDGAGAIFASLRDRGHRIALATGCWRRSAERKLGRADIAHDGVPLASCDDHVARTGIVRAALAKAAARDGERVVYVGDGAWDVKATRELGIPLVGVDREGDGKLASLELGFPIVRDYVDVEAFERALAAAS